MTQGTEYTRAVDQFKGMLHNAEKDQWKLAEYAYIGVQAERDSRVSQREAYKGFASDVSNGIDVSWQSIQRWYKTWEWRIAHTSFDPSITYADASIMGNASDVTLAAYQAVAEHYGIKMHTAKSKTAEVTAFKDYMEANPDVVDEVMADEGARQKVTQSMFKAVSADVDADDLDTSPKGGFTPPTPREMSNIMIIGDLRRIGDDVRGDLTGWSGKAKLAKRQWSDEDQAALSDIISDIETEIAIVRSKVNLDGKAVTRGLKALDAKAARKTAVTESHRSNR